MAVSRLDSAVDPQCLYIDFTPMHLLMGRRLSV